MDEKKANEIADAIDKMISGAIRDYQNRDEYDDYGGMDRWDGKRKLIELLIGKSEE